METPKQTNPISQATLDELVRRIVEAVHPLRIILFGSAARGEMGRHSDIDVMVVMPDGTHRRNSAKLVYRNLAGFGKPVDVVVATMDDLEKYRDSIGLIYREALRDGKEIYVH
jgi:predicted nucleotidyltransferase